MAKQGGWAAPDGTFRGAAKLEPYVKIWGGEKYFEAGENLYGGGKRPQTVGKISNFQKKEGRQKFMGQ